MTRQYIETKRGAEGRRFILPASLAYPGRPGVGELAQMEDLERYLAEIVEPTIA